jgi:hypothetical protein
LPLTGVNVWAGRLDGRSFSGQLVDYHVKVGSLALQVKETSTRILSPETEVWVRFPPDRCMLLIE